MIVIDSESSTVGEGSAESTVLVDFVDLLYSRGPQEFVHPKEYLGHIFPKDLQD